MKPFIKVFFILFVIVGTPRLCVAQISEEEWGALKEEQSGIQEVAPVTGDTIPGDSKIIESVPAATAPASEVVPAPLPAPVTSPAPATPVPQTPATATVPMTNQTYSQLQSDYYDDGENETEAYKEYGYRSWKEMYSAGVGQRGVGIGFTVTGGIFLVGAIVYTVMFLISEETFGIPIDGEGGDDYLEFYLNPGIFAIPVAAPCMAIGITNLVKGAIKTGKAKKYVAAVSVAPYVACNVRHRLTRAGVQVEF